MTSRDVRLLDILPDIRGEYREDFLLAPLTWFKVGGNAEVFVKPRDIDDLQFLLRNTRRDVDVNIIGACSNLLIRDGGIDGIVIKLGRAFSDIELQGDLIKVGAATLNFNLSQFCYNHSITGFEFLIGIPGSCGGGIAMNAGAYNKEFKDIVHSIEVVDRDGNIHNIRNHDIGFSYRSNNLPDDVIITSATFVYDKSEKSIIKDKMDDIIDRRSRSQPVKERTCGSVFANIPGMHVWKIIDEVGMRGASIGGAMISEMHCNFMINTGNATASNLEDLGEMVRENVMRKKKIDLIWEIKRFGKR